MTAINTNVVNQIKFQEGFNHLIGKLEPKVFSTSAIIRKPVSGEKTMINFIGNVQARKISGHVVKVQFDDIDLSRRQLTTERFVISLPMDDEQIREMQQDPTSLTQLTIFCVDA